MKEFNISKTDRLLIVSPHPDDESIGCGGVLSIFGSQCDILLLTDGRFGYKGTYDQEQIKMLVERRREELCQAADIAGTRKVYSLNIPDNQLYKNYKVVASFDFSPYSYIFVPNRLEIQTDHRVVFGMIKRIKRRSMGRVKGKIVEYEVWTPLVKPTTIYDITSVIEKKKAMIAAHESQISDIDYVEKGIALNVYRGIYESIPYGEAFCLDNFLERLKYLFFRLPEYIKRYLLHMFGRSI